MAIRPCSSTKNLYCFFNFQVDVVFSSSRSYYWHKCNTFLCFFGSLLNPMLLNIWQIEINDRKRVYFHAFFLSKQTEFAKYFLSFQYRFSISMNIYIAPISLNQTINRRYSMDIFRQFCRCLQHQLANHRISKLKRYNSAVVIWQYFTTRNTLSFTQ